MNHVSFLLTRSYKDANRLSNATADWNLISQNCFWLLYMCFWNKLGQHTFCLWILLQFQHIHSFDILSWHNMASCCKKYQNFQSRCNPLASIAWALHEIPVDILPLEVKKAICYLSYVPWSWKSIQYKESKSLIGKKDRAIIHPDGATMVSKKKALEPWPDCQLHLADELCRDVLMCQCIIVTQILKYQPCPALNGIFLHAWSHWILHLCFKYKKIINYRSCINSAHFRHIGYCATRDWDRQQNCCHCCSCF